MDKKTEKVLMLDRKYKVALIGEPTKNEIGKRRLLANATYIYGVGSVIPPIGPGGAHVLVSPIGLIVGVSFGVSAIQERWE